MPNMCKPLYVSLSILVMAVESVLTGWPNTHINQQQTTWCEGRWVVSCCISVLFFTFKFIWISLFIFLSVFISVIWKSDWATRWADTARMMNLLGKRREMTRHRDRGQMWSREFSQKWKGCHSCRSKSEWLFPCSTKSVYSFPCTCNE